MQQSRQRQQVFLVSTPARRENRDVISCTCLFQRRSLLGKVEAFVRTRRRLKLVKRLRKAVAPRDRPSPTRVDFALTFSFPCSPEDYSLLFVHRTMGRRSLLRFSLSARHGPARTADPWINEISALRGIYFFGFYEMSGLGFMRWVGLVSFGACFV